MHEGIGVQDNLVPSHETIDVRPITPLYKNPNFWIGVTSVVLATIAAISANKYSTEHLLANKAVVVFCSSAAGLILPWAAKFGYELNRCGYLFKRNHINAE